MNVPRLLREPLPHFLLLGLALFLLYGRVSPGDDDRHIVVSQAQIDDLAAQHEKLWGRPPTPADAACVLKDLPRRCRASHRRRAQGHLGPPGPVASRAAYLIRELPGVS